MEITIKVDGIPMKLENPDIDGNGITGGTEKIIPFQDRGITNITTPTELGESLVELNKDEIDAQSRMTGIDMRSRLHYAEISSILALDALVALGVCHTKMLSFTRQKKRLTVSLQGLGRQEIVSIVGGKREHDTQTIGDKFKGFLGMNKQQE